uniref:C-type lectin domain-containing protein n=1 Tax=Heterorhabditis bacteriophora TaxID=37862 RepID=A0A1I7WR11_HETBA
MQINMIYIGSDVLKLVILMSMTDNALGHHQCSWNSWELIKQYIGRRLNSCISLLASNERRTSIGNYTDDEKWIMYNNTKRTYSWVDPGQPTTSTVILLHDNSSRPFWT